MKTRTANIPRHLSTEENKTGRFSLKAQKKRKPGIVKTRRLHENRLPRGYQRGRPLVCISTNYEIIGNIKVCKKTPPGPAQSITPTAPSIQYTALNPDPTGRMQCPISVGNITTQHLIAEPENQ